MGLVPDSYLVSLCAFVVYSDEFVVAIGGDSLADSVHSFHQHLSDPHDPVPGPSQGVDSVVCFLYRLVASSGSSPHSALGVADEHRGMGVGLLWGWGVSIVVPSSFCRHFCFAPSLFFACSLFFSTFDFLLFPFWRFPYAFFSFSFAYCRCEIVF